MITIGRSPVDHSPVGRPLTGGVARRWITRGGSLAGGPAAHRWVARRWITRGGSLAAGPAAHRWVARRWITRGGSLAVDRSPVGRPLTGGSLVVGQHADSRASPSWSDAAAEAAISVNVGHGAPSRCDRCSSERCPGDVVGFAHCDRDCLSGRRSRPPIRPGHVARSPEAHPTPLGPGRRRPPPGLRDWPIRLRLWWPRSRPARPRSA
jgi:hypothetical protein